eukprot:CAMPEP_0172539368 /NCGR_PEP_ID=MMETSP1067-20121228/10572_1 /TAXON_ID=265564 ORGANISM="Thalassiosira punctigera, Strain Tpunct2005C2" /NCGR_SAMPLE_ID=MMETSP1067 /ASSEMBLY_ACC=CAM_ASM_000444 /LENGTH=692 /DNA_ID=CAMNT_0013325039 /DNA_START=9 /DNA_END=2087 /DNA_ORIENTATION=-
MASASERRSQRELAEARASGNAPPEVDVKTGAMINPHNPEFITKKPWYLAEGHDGGGPTLDHQADQRKEEDRRELSLGEADRLVKEERERIKRKLEKQRLREKSRKKKRRSYDEEEDAELFESGMWIEALRKNKKPYLIAQIVRVGGKGKSFDLKYEDGYIERNVRPWGDKSKSSSNSNAPRMRVTRTGNRSIKVHKNLSGKETYDSKRDSYHGVEIDGHMKKMEKKHREREALRKEQRQAEREQMKKDQEEELVNKEKQEKPSDSDSDSDSDIGDGNNDGFSSSEDEVLQRDADAKMFSTRLARQGGVGGAQMKVTARNLRIREDTAKYLRNLDPNSAYYDPKSRSMRDNPYANNAEDGSNLQQQQAAAESLGFAGDNFSRISGDAVKLAETQLFAWDAEKKLGVEGAVHIQADPSKAELMRRRVESRGVDLKEKKRRAVLDRYGGEEYLDASSGAANKSADASAPPKESLEERATRFGVSHTEQEYGRDGRLASAGASGSLKLKKRAPIPCKYEENMYPNGHTAVWGSYFHKGAFSWGYADDHSLIRSSYGTGPNGRIANDESNELHYGSGVAGSAMLASARKMLEVIPNSNNNSTLSGDFKPNQQSKLYGEAVGQHKEFDKEKLRAAMGRQEKAEKAATAKQGGKRKYNSLSAEVDVTEEDMEAYRLRKGRGAEDPMANLGGGLLDYQK